MLGLGHYLSRHCCGGLLMTLMEELMTLTGGIIIGFAAGHSWVTKYGPLPASLPFYSHNTDSSTGYINAPQSAYTSYTEYPAAPAEPEDVYYQNCRQARAAGASRIRWGEPGYGPHLDRDGDGNPLNDLTDLAKGFFNKK